MSRAVLQKFVCACLVILLASFLLGCGSDSKSQEPAAEVVGIEVVEETGLLEAEELPNNTFAFEIMPEADDHIYQMRIEYYGGKDHEFLGQLVLEPETLGYFTREETFRRGFTVPDSKLLEDFTLSFILIDEQDQEYQAKPDYSVDASYGLTYFLKIGGSRAEGYTIETH